MHATSQQPRVRRRGYTLIELIVVIGILGLASALLIPQLVGRDTMAVQSAVRLLIGDITFAQSDALAHQELRRVHFYDDGRGYCLTRIVQGDLGQPFNAGTADFIIDPLKGDADDYIVDFAMDDRFEGISIISTDIDGADGEDLNFDALGGTVMNGNIPGTGGTIVIGTADIQFQITISPFTGKMTVVRL